MTSIISTLKTQNDGLSSLYGSNTYSVSVKSRRMLGNVHGNVGKLGWRWCWASLEEPRASCNASYRRNEKHLIDGVWSGFEFGGIRNVNGVGKETGRRKYLDASVVVHADDLSAIPVPTGRIQTEETRRDLAQVLRLALPALGIVLADPLQTLVDSACVGRFSPTSSTLQLAALGPNTAIFNATFQVLSFIGVAVANIVASQSLSAQGLHSAEELRRRKLTNSAIGTSLVLATVLGTAASVLLLGFGPMWLSSMGTHPSVLPLASEYCRIRAFGLPAVLLIAACQGSCLGRQDTLTPMKVCIAATALNLAGDIFLVMGMHMGVAGAAIATASAQWIAAIWFLLREKKEWDRTGLNPLKDYYNGETLLAFGKMAAALVFRSAAGIVAYFAMAVAAAKMGVVAVAAHQVAMQSFWFFSFIPEPISMAAQTLVAKERKNASVASRWARILLVSGTLAGIILAVAVALQFQYGSSIFTTDLAVIGHVKNLTPWGTICMLICGVMMAFDGISIGDEALVHLPIAVAGGMIVTLTTLWVGLAKGAGLVAVWWSLCAFYGGRLAGHLIYYGFIAGERSVFNPLRVLKRT